MPHNSLINGTSHGISSAQTIINGTGYKINSGKTLINGTGRNIAFAPKKWTWNAYLHKPSAKIVADVSFTTPEYAEVGAWKGIQVYPRFDLPTGSVDVAYYSVRDSRWYTVYVEGSQWQYVGYRTVLFDEPPTGDLLTYLQANATPIYN